MSKPIQLLILGADGFIGQHFIAFCKKNNISFICYTRNEDKANAPGYISGSLADLEGHLDENSIIVNASGNKRNESSMYEDNVILVKHLVTLCKKRNCSLLHIGSAGIYGIADQHVNVIDEESEPITANTYEKTKWQADQEIIQSNINYCILRPTNVFGEWDKEKKLLNLIHQIQKNRFFLLNTRAMTNYVYVGYLAECMFQIVTRKEFTRQVFNVNQEKGITDFISGFYYALGRSDQPMTLPYLLRPMIAMLSRLSPLLPSRMRVITPSKYRELTSEKVISSEKLRKILPLMNHDIQQGINNLVTYYKENQLL